MKRALAVALSLTLGAGFGCAPGETEPTEPLDFPGGGGGKSDALGRGLVGVASDYEASDLDAEALAGDYRERRAVAWQTVEKILAPVPLLGLADDAAEHPEIELPDGEIPTVARWQTWYGISDIKRMFQHLYEGIGPSGRAIRQPFGGNEIDEAFSWNAKALERATSWPLERYFAYVRSLGICPEALDDEACAKLVESQISGAASGNARILYSPAVASQVLANYGEMLACDAGLDDLSMSAKPDREENFTACFAAELATNAVLVKAQWQRADFDRGVPTFDTSGAAMRARLAQSAQWPELGDRERRPDAGEVFTIRLRNGDTYRLAGLHIMTKELRHWQWITLWWSDQPTRDFGADRPSSFGETLPSVWANYKMCVVGSFEEADADAAQRFSDLPTLADAIEATSGASGQPTWCSNPYLEHGRNNAATNCIGCHQHGGSTVSFDIDGNGALDPFDVKVVLENEARFPGQGRRRVRDLFPADYMFSFNRVDDLVGVIRSEADFWDGSDAGSIRARIEAIEALPADPERGASAFAQRCAGCHGEDGRGSPNAPNLENRAPSRDDAMLLQSLLLGRGQMPAWADIVPDQELADLLGFLRAAFGGP